MEKKEWVILVAQLVTGKSKFPHSKVGDFNRYKPWPYYDSNKPHRILYARRFFATDEEALGKAKQVEQEMFNTYVFGMGVKATKHTCVSEYTVVLHNITNNVSTQIASTENGDQSDQAGYLFEGEMVTNKKLGSWGVVNGLK